MVALPTSSSSPFRTAAKRYCWIAFKDGDRANGGLFDVCARAGELIMVREWTTSCAACTEGYETQRLRWDGGKFVLVSDVVTRFDGSDHWQVRTVCGDRTFDF
jgi:hypothetical protein